jgi:hypothetical protein
MVAIAVYTVRVGAEPRVVRATITGNLSAVTRPELAVISVGADSRFCHPSVETLAQFEGAGFRGLRMDQVGTVEIVADGERYSVCSWRNRQAKKTACGMLHRPLLMCCSSRAAATQHTETRSY